MKNQLQILNYYKYSFQKLMSEGLSLWFSSLSCPFIRSILLPYKRKAHLHLARNYPVHCTEMQKPLSTKGQFQILVFNSSAESLDSNDWGINPFAKLVVPNFLLSTELKDILIELSADRSLSIFF